MNAWVKAMSGINELKSFGGDDCLTENAEWRNMPKNDGKYRMYEEERKKKEKKLTWQVRACRKVQLKLENAIVPVRNKADCNAQVFLRTTYALG